MGCDLIIGRLTLGWCSIEASENAIENGLTMKQPHRPLSSKLKNINSPKTIGVSKFLLGFLACVAVGASQAEAKGGTAKPPKPGTVIPVGPGTAITTIVAPLIPPVVPPPVFSAPVGTIVGFDVTGFIQSATLNLNMCPQLPANQQGGTVVVNGRTIVVPCNTILQLPAATFNWADLFGTTSGAPLALDDTIPGESAPTFKYPSMEISIAGNIVGGRSIAGLINISQQSLNGGFGFITRIDYSDGSIYVGDSPAGSDHVRLVINDPSGRFGRPQSPDARFSVDDENPTIVAHTGYPMCVPRTRVDLGIDDPLCPKKNRPLAAGGCRNFSNAGVVSPAGWELSPPAAGQTYCSAFVMKAPLGTPATAGLPVAFIAQTAAEPDARQQAPFQVGDSINYSSTLMKGSKGGPNGSDTLSVHTIEANLGIYTQPGTLPSYISIEETIFGTDAVPVAGQAAVAALEGQDRFVLVGMTTDVVTPVDAYMIDIDPATGAETQRWITTEAMTGGITPGSAPFGGGITTQLIGPQAGRFRVRANKAPPGVLVSPTRYARVVSRALCAPATVAAVAPSATTLGSPAYWDINATAPVVGAPVGTTAKCLERAPAANGLFSGQYLAPVGEYIFPENVVAGDPLVPFNFWNLGFLMNGEGPGTGRLQPTPW